MAQLWTGCAAGSGTEEDDDMGEDGFWVLTTTVWRFETEEVSLSSRSPPRGGGSLIGMEEGAFPQTTGRQMEELDVRDRLEEGGSWSGETLLQVGDDGMASLVQLVILIGWRARGTDLSRAAWAGTYARDDVGRERKDKNNKIILTCPRHQLHVNDALTPRHRINGRCGVFENMKRPGMRSLRESSRSRPRVITPIGADNQRTQGQKGEYPEISRYHGRQN